MRTRLLLIVIAFALIPLQLTAWDAELERATPGGVIVITAESADELAGGGELRIAGRGVSGGEVFPYGEEVFLLLLPVPSDPASMQVEILIRNRDGTAETRQIALIPREFISEDISLNGSMSNLRQSDDGRKAEESRLLWQLLGEFDPDAEIFDQPLLLPVGEARQSSRYGDRRMFLYRDGSSSRALHYGIDYAVPVGTPVRAAAAGRVVFAADRMLTGSSLVLQHGPGIYSLYYHLDSLSVAEGQSVEPGELIGISGVSGLATGAHLHWEMRINRIPVDPLLFLDRPVYP